ncbi:uncharacterized protein VTP21DRAFT_6460 [Calcarisporiella thermophila]|uniref:uncharacterized protein n=1 Tax=Calcarisporiella thermophila TaxID=911321 RepID=UPI003742DD5A
MVKEIETRAEFEEIISKNPIVIIDFFATWCGPCKVIAPKFVKFSEEYTNAVFIKIDVDKLGDIAAEYGVAAMPTFVIIKNGQKADSVVGANPKGLEDKIKAHVQ